jgi:uncharacterized membrane protein YkvA (DUF1232 family)
LEDPHVLFELVERVCGTIDALPDAPHPDLSRQILYDAPDSVAEFATSANPGGAKLTDEKSAGILAQLAHASIKSIPRSARGLATKIHDPSVDNGQRCAIASILAYLVQPHDLIPDDAPGHYGYLDDAALLNAGLAEYLDTLPPGADANALAIVASHLVWLSPAHVRPRLQQGISSMSRVVQTLRNMSPDSAENILQIVVANPLAQPRSMTAPPGFALRAARDYSQGFWTHSGCHVDGDNYLMGGGGPSLINGQLFIPS